MENKEALEYLRNHNKYYEPVNREAFRVIEKSLDELEELKEIMGKPIQEIRKNLKILEEIREYIKVIDYGEKFQNRYALQAGYVIYPIKKDVYDRWSRWLG